MKNKNKIFDIAICGSGLSAKTAVASFSKQGFKLIWINDINDKKYEDDRTTMLSPVSFDFYQNLNLLGPSGAFFPTKKILVKVKNQKNYTTFEDDQFYKPLCYLAENKLLHQELDLIISSQKKEQKIFEFKEKIKFLNANNYFNEIIFESGKKSHSSLVIGIDGANSLIRDLSGIKTNDLGIKKYGLVGLIEHEIRHPSTSWQVFSEEGILALLAKENKTENRGISSMIWSIDETRKNYLLSLSTDDFERQIENEIGTEFGKLNLVSKISEWPIKRIDVMDPTSKRTIVLGDASHSIYPLAGQGFNLAIGDIIQLLETLKWARKLGMDFGSSIFLNKYKNKRWLWINSVTKLTDGIDWLFTNSSSETQNKFGIGLSLLEKFDPIKRKLVSIMSQN